MTEWLKAFIGLLNRHTRRLYHGFESHFLRHGSGTGGRNYVRERTSWCWWSPPEDRIALLSERRARCFDRPIFLLFISKLPPAVPGRLSVLEHVGRGD